MSETLPYERNVDGFFEAIYPDDVTYSGVRLVDWDTDGRVTAESADTTSWFSRNVPLKIPIASAAMDTVTESDMAIEMARRGGIGVVHAALSAEDQATEVRRTKLFLNGRIDNPFVARPSDSLNHILRRLHEKQLDFRTVPITSRGRLLGLLTGDDFTLTRDKSIRASEVMRPLDELVTANDDTDIEEAHDMMFDTRKKTIPVVNGRGQLTGMYQFSDVDAILSGDRASYNVDANDRLIVAAAVSSHLDGDNGAIARIEAFRKYVDAVVIDSAHGDFHLVFEAVRQIKKLYGDEFDVVAGNISAYPQAMKYVEAGADGIKVGQGPGSICTTRPESGIGKPQVSAVYDVERITRGHGVPIIADGGIVNNGDITIAIAAGAHSVMVGGMLAGTEEAPGQKFFDEELGRWVKTYRGMASRAALQASAASRERYGKRVNSLPEGVESLVPVKGPVGDILLDAEAGLRAGMKYSGYATLDELRRYARFGRIDAAGQHESRPHIGNIVG